MVERKGDIPSPSFADLAGPATLEEFKALVAANPDDVLGNLNALLALVGNNPADALRYIVETNLSRPGRDSAIKDAVLELADMVANGSVSPVDAASELDAMARFSTSCSHTASDCRAAARGLRRVFIPAH